MYTNILVPTDERSPEIKRAKTAVPRASSARKPGSSAEKHDILLLNTLSRPFSYSDSSARASRQTFQQTSESTKCKRHLKSNSKA